METMWADDLIKQYGDGRKELQRKKSKLNNEDPFDQQDLTQINSMISEMSFVMEWLDTGRQPGTYKGADKKRIYQRQSFASMDFIPDITEQLEEGPKQLYMTKEEKIILAEIFGSLSHRERQCYILHTAAQMSMSEVAAELGLSKWTARGYIDRAKKKVEKLVLKETS